MQLGRELPPEHEPKENVRKVSAASIDCTRSTQSSGFVEEGASFAISANVSARALGAQSAPQVQLPSKENRGSASPSSASPSTAANLRRVGLKSHMRVP